VTLSPATFYDDNGVVRLQGQLDGGGGAQPFSAYVLGPFDVAWDDPGVGSNPGVLLTTVPAGSLFICTRCIVKEQFDSAGGPELRINVQFGDLHDYWNTDIWAVGQTAVTDGLAGAVAQINPDGTQNGAFFEAAGNLRAVVLNGSGTQGHADIYALIATL
jgi:hypothetical protein